MCGSRYLRPYFPIPYSILSRQLVVLITDSQMPASETATHSGGRPYYPALTGLRAIAAYLIFFLHFRPALDAEWVQAIFSHFYVGVSMFFVLSGFVIATRYQGNVRLSRSWWWAYFWRRVARIYPAYLLLNGMVLAQLYWPIPAGKGLNTVMLVFLSQSLLRGFSSTLKYVGLPQGWSLTVEECFYFSAPLLLAWQRWGRRGLVGFTASVLGIGLLLTYWCIGRPALHGFFGSYYHLFNYTFFGRVFEFVIGVGLARWWVARAATTAAGQWPWRTLAGLMLMSLTVGILAWLQPPMNFYDGLLQPGAIALNNLIFPAGVALLLAGLLAEISWLRTILASRLMQFLGRSSYFFYLVHISTLSLWWAKAFGPATNSGWRFLATVAIAAVGYQFIEEPLRRWVLDHTSSNKAPANKAIRNAQTIS
ncbi:Peptidoglycan/LPS O-acetylase OafA/YrhL, contains acyltransferase and SGNH-hydrolase domains [Hymenobacter arizonensis]|uniref:Peptidoglycan/LPS O-acetylase OafA/YrhL, contains acyltransferase and SGNH-hydrolase domains n=2 Tax=Hymenobacter arizonensis TaxID=1227077 RepID=A0A1I5SVS9_HYMAR|nr:Peptidoglycan/LPS O-acetylase OafA/YrhL, contains acyltransferase and SGNH-hydrolase domains [Hymenobacter arizonensis]